MQNNRGRFFLCFGVAAFGFSTVSMAATFSFFGLTNNDPVDTAIGEAQLFVDVENGAGTITFTFRNEGPEDSVISEIYFDDGSLLGISAVIDPLAGVDFAEDASPPNLPGGDLLIPAFEVTKGFLAEAVPSAAMNGVGPLEEVGIMFDLINGGTLQDVLDELADGTLRVGIHVIAFASGGSESFVIEDTPIPEPTSALLLIAGISAASLGRSRRRS